MYIFPRLAQLDTPDETRVNIAVLELGGQFIIKTEEQFANITEEELCASMRAVSLDSKMFLDLVNASLKSLGLDNVTLGSLE